LEHGRDYLERKRKKKEKDKYIVILEEEMRQVREQEILKETLKSRSHSKSSKTITPITHYEKESRLINNFYYPPPARPRREHRELRPIRVYFLHFYGKDNVESYLDWEINVEQLFACLQVSEERKVLLATLSFIGNAMYWWTSLKRERKIDECVFLPSFNV